MALRHPTLYACDGDAISILGQACAACGHVMVPRQPYGCELCGGHGSALEPTELAPAGELVAFAQVHRHRGSDIAAPFIIGEIRLASGPFFRCTMASADPADLRVGMRIEGVLITADGPEGPQDELRFRPMEPTANA